ncbi:hypothetical protein NLX83_10400 [Allokutzneria sp. A3M-2-11 16]|uniref:hypothetical protein n=1 Tax=Allokutzneria sp. A3M-2-11 16 TaxID=2962043 RepID=UPI0020B6E69C|nr:hypothetical protein [Allokutzneria sp. A3M-2-11 16]MCP3799667.1 hypothetical protein [Allokutzneria sp. A3M-2-11 16]
MRISILLPVVAAAALSVGFTGTASAAPAGMPEACKQFAELVQAPQAAFQMTWTEGGRKMSGWKCAVAGEKNPKVCEVDEFGNTAKVLAVWVAGKSELKFYKGLGDHKFVEAYGPTGNVTQLPKPITVDGYCATRG